MILCHFAQRPKVSVFKHHGRVQGHPSVAAGHPSVADPPRPSLLFPRDWLALLFFSCLVDWTGFMWVVLSSLA